VPLSDEKQNFIYDELSSVLDPDYVSDYPAVMQCYTGDLQTPNFATKVWRNSIILPGGKEDMQQITKRAARHKSPFSEVGSGSMGACAMPIEL